MLTVRAEQDKPRRWPSLRSLFQNLETHALTALSSRMRPMKITAGSMVRTTIRRGCNAEPITKRRTEIDPQGAARCAGPTFGRAARHARADGRREDARLRGVARTGRSEHQSDGLNQQHQLYPNVHGGTERTRARSALDAANLTKRRARCAFSDANASAMASSQYHVKAAFIADEQRGEASINS